MKKSLPCLITLALLILARAPLAQTSLPLPLGEGRDEGASVADHANNSTQVRVPSAANAETDQVPPGNKLLIQAAAQLDRRASVSAKLRHQIAIGSAQLYGVGSYWQQGSGEERKLRFELQIAGQEAAMLQVSNSRFSWIDRRLPTGRSVVRIDLRQLRADPSLVSTNLNDIKPGEANWSTTSPELTSYIGGLPSLLASLEQNFAFLPPQAMRLTVPTSVQEELASVPVWAVVGQWKPERLAALFLKTQNADDEPPADPSELLHKKLPERMPQEVLLLVGQADKFPYRIEYRKLETPQAVSTDGPSIPYQLSVHPMIVLEYSDVVFDAPIAAGQFDYAPGDADFDDQTTAILERLRQQHQSQVATRPATEAATPARQ
jgi:hypothetical protein